MVAELRHKLNIPVTIHKFSKLTNTKLVKAERIEATKARETSTKRNRKCLLACTRELDSVTEGS